MILVNSSESAYCFLQREDYIKCLLKIKKNISIFILNDETTKKFSSFDKRHMKKHL